MNVKELIEINEIKSKTITDLICHKNTKEEEKETLLACRRFIRGFIYELKQLQNEN